MLRCFLPSCKAVKTRVAVPPLSQVIMYDEPTAGLDPVASTVVEDLIRDLHEKHGEGHHHEVRRA